MAKSVYNLYGSEDGTFGVATNKKRAWEMAVKYLRVNETELKDAYGKKITYNKMCRDNKGLYLVETIYAPDNTNVTIEEFILNNY